MSLELEQKPARYEHNCTQCVYLGRFNNQDAYYCPDRFEKDLSKGESSYIARYGNEPSGYSSCPDFWNQCYINIDEGWGTSNMSPEEREQFIRTKVWFSMLGGNGWGYTRKISELEYDIKTLEKGLRWMEEKLNNLLKGRKNEND